VLQSPYSARIHEAADDAQLHASCKTLISSNLSLNLKFSTSSAKSLPPFATQNDPTLLVAAREGNTFSWPNIQSDKIHGELLRFHTNDTREARSDRRWMAREQALCSSVSPVGGGGKKKKKIEYRRIAAATCDARDNIFKSGCSRSLFNIEAFVDFFTAVRNVFLLQISSSFLAGSSMSVLAITNA